MIHSWFTPLLISNGALRHLQVLKTTNKSDFGLWTPLGYSLANTMCSRKIGSFLERSHAETLEIVS